MNNYIIEASDNVIIDKRIDDILKSNKLDKNSIIKYDMSINTINELMEELDTYNFLTDTKIVICNNCKFLEAVDKDFKYLIKYVNNYNKSNYLIMITSKLSDRKEIKDLIDGKNIEVIKGDVSIEMIMSSKLKDYKMDMNTKQYLIQHCLYDNERIICELEKLMVFKFDDKIITKEDVNLVVEKSYDDNVFDLVNKIAKRDKKGAYSVYKRLIVKEKDTINIVASIAGNLRMMYTAKVLTSENMSTDKIASYLGVKPKAVSIALENSRNFSLIEITKYLSKLADIDFNTKSGVTNDNMAFEEFLLDI